MALSANSVWEVRTAGSDTNGGAFVAGASGTDFSQQNSKNTAGNNISTTDLVATGVATVTSATASFTAAIVGNIIYLSGTGLTTGWYQAVTFTNSTTIVLDRSPGTGTNGVMNIGGALASLGMVGASFITSNIVWIKNGSYSVTSASNNVSGGCFSSAAATCRVEGYNSTRGDMGSPPTLTASGISTFILVNFTGNEVACGNLILNGSALTSSCATAGSGRMVWYGIAAQNCTNGGIKNTSGSALAINCTATGCSVVSAIRVPRCYGCQSFSNTVTAFDSDASPSGYFVNCLAYGNTGATSDGFNPSSNATLINCVAYGNGRDGFRAGGGAGLVGMLQNCIAEANTGFGFNDTGDSFQLMNCAAYNNTGGNTSFSSSTINTSFTIGVSSFFIAAGSNNFQLNNTAGAGGALRGTAFPASFASGSTSTFRDVGIAQHQDSPDVIAPVINMYETRYQ